MKIKHYGIIIALFYTAVTVVAIIGALILQPFYGDLTRIGGFAENSYGWTVAQQTIASPVDSVAVTLTPEARGREADIWVFGDSFSHYGMENRHINPDNSIDIPATNLNNWTDWLSAMSGQSVLVFHLEHEKLDELLNSEQFQNNPPKLMIYQTVERALKTRAVRFADPSCGQGQPAVNDNRLDISLHTVETAAAYPPPKAGLLNFTDLFHLLKMQMNSKKEVREYRLNTDTLFSSHKADSLLIFHHDLMKNDWIASDIDNIRCSFNTLRSRIEANGRTRFLALVAPDKSTVYQQYAPKLTITPTVVDFETELPATVPIAQKLIDQVEGGAIDVYFPNDTHFGYLGHRLAAEAVVHYLQDSDPQ